MNLVQKQSLALMDEFLNNLSVEEFLADYLEVEDFEGVTVDEHLASVRLEGTLSVLEPSVAIAGFYHATLAESTVTCANSVVLKTKSVEVAPFTGANKTSGSFALSANDSIYSLAA